MHINLSKEVFLTWIFGHLSKILLLNQNIMVLIYLFNNLLIFISGFNVALEFISVRHIFPES